jgi:hypothetical protein
MLRLYPKSKGAPKAQNLCAFVTVRPTGKTKGADAAFWPSPKGALKAQTGREPIGNARCLIAPKGKPAEQSHGPRRL